MVDIEAEIVVNQGIYPFNYGRVTQSELCRRADVKKAMLQNPLRKDSTRVDFMAWLDALNSKLTQARESTPERKRPDSLSAAFIIDRPGYLTRETIELSIWQTRVL